MRESIHLYGYIGSWDYSAKWLQTELERCKEAETIDLYINSGGGSVFEGVAMIAMLKRCGKVVDVHIEGLCASMATCLALCGNTISMVRSSMFMVHNPSGLAWGDYREMEKTASLLIKLRDDMAVSYQRHTGLSLESIKKMMDDETYLNADEALEKGFIDSVIECVDEKKTPTIEDVMKEQEQATAEASEAMAMAAIKAENEALKAQNATQQAEINTLTAKVDDSTAAINAMKEKMQSKEDAQRIDVAVSALKVLPADRDKEIQMVSKLRKVDASLADEYLQNIDARKPQSELTSGIYDVGEERLLGMESGKVYGKPTAESVTMDKAIKDLQAKHGISYEEAVNMYVATI